MVGRGPYYPGFDSNHNRSLCSSTGSRIQKGSCFSTEDLFIRPFRFDLSLLHLCANKQFQVWKITNSIISEGNRKCGNSVLVRKSRGKIKGASENKRRSGKRSFRSQTGGGKALLFGQSR